MLPPMALLIDAAAALLFCRLLMRRRCRHAAYGITLPAAIRAPLRDVARQDAMMPRRLIDDFDA